MRKTQVAPTLYAGLKIKKLTDNPAKEGTLRAAMLSVMLKSRTTDKAYATPIKVGKKTVFIGSEDFRFAAAAGIIELV